MYITCTEDEYFQDEKSEVKTVIKFGLDKIAMGSNRHSTGLDLLFWVEMIGFKGQMPQSWDISNTDISPYGTIRSELSLYTVSVYVHIFSTRVNVQ
jgi:hypothetical protein